MNPSDQIKMSNVRAVECATGGVPGAPALRYGS
jgi:hypothetical protein